MLRVMALGAVCELWEEDPAAYADQPVPEIPAGGGFVAYHPDLPTLGQPEAPDPLTLHFKLTEFADLSDGRRVVFRDERGFSQSLRAVDWNPETGEARDASWRPGSELESLVSDPWRFETRESLTESVIGALEPDDDQEWYEWVVERLRTLGAEVDPRSVEGAPYRVEFGSGVLEELKRRGR